MNKKIRCLHVLVLLAISCAVSQNFSMDRAASEVGDRATVETIERRYHLTLNLAEPEGALPRLCELAKTNGKKTLWRTWAYEDITQAIADLQKVQAHCTDYKDAALTETVSNLLLNFGILKYMVARQNGFETENIAAGVAADVVADERAERVRVDGAHERAIADAQTTLTRAAEAHDKVTKALAALTGRVETHDKFATDIASLTSKVAAHDNLVGTIASLKSEIDGLSSSVSSRFTDSETREKTEFARMTAAHDKVAAALAALAGKVDATHDCVFTHLSTVDSRLMESEKLGKTLDASLAEFKGRANPLLDDLARRMGLVESLASATNVAYYEFKDKKLNPLLSALEVRMGTLASQACVNATAASLNSAVEGHGSRINALESRVAAVEGLFSKVSELESLVGSRKGIYAKYDLEARMKDVEDWMYSSACQTTESRLKAVEGVPSRASAIESRLGAMDTRMTGFASQADLAHFCCNLNAVEDKRRAMESRLATVEGLSSKSAGLEARLKAIEADHRLLAAAHKFCPICPTSATPTPSFYHH